MTNPAFRAGLLAGIAVVGVGGCTNARDEFIDFGDRVIDASNVDIDGAIVSELPNIDGEFYAVARPDLPEDRFISYIFTYDITPVTENTALLDYSAACLDVDTQEPVDFPPLTDTDIAVGSDGTWDGALVGTFYGRCNPITGSTVQADAMVHGQLLTDDFLCGTLSGSAGGFSLEGTTFAAQRITGDTLPAPIWRCEDQPLP